MYKKDGRLALSQFRRLKQLGTGDVGLVDMVELQNGSGRWGSCLCCYKASYLSILLLHPAFSGGSEGNAIESSGKLATIVKD